MESRFWREAVNVLILVLMEDTLREQQSLSESSFGMVLILVLMEDTLRVVQKLSTK